MRIRLLALLSVVALGGIAVFTAISSAGDGSTPLASSVTRPMDNAVRHADLKRVQSSQVSWAAAPNAPASLTVRYLVFTTHAIAGRSASPIWNATCPTGTAVLNGFYKTDRFVNPDVSNAATTRTWQFGFDNYTTTTGHYRFGIICAHG